MEKINYEEKFLLYCQLLKEAGNDFSDVDIKC